MCHKLLEITIQKYVSAVFGMQLLKSKLSGKLS